MMDTDDWPDVDSCEADGNADGVSDAVSQEGVQM